MNKIEKKFLPLCVKATKIGDVYKLRLRFSVQGVKDEFSVETTLMNESLIENIKNYFNMIIYKENIKRFLKNTLSFSNGVNILMSSLVDKKIELCNPNKGAELIKEAYASGGLLNIKGVKLK